MPWTGRGGNEDIQLARRTPCLESSEVAEAEELAGLECSVASISQSVGIVGNDDTVGLRLKASPGGGCFDKAQPWRAQVRIDSDAYGPDAVSVQAK